MDRLIGGVDYPGQSVPQVTIVDITIKTEGIGPGLVIVKPLVEGHDGTFAAQRPSGRARLAGQVDAL